MAEALLNKRGIPFTYVNVERAEGAAKLQALTGELTAPVLQAGDKLVVKGYNEERWQALLDEAGYPKALPQRTRPVARPAEAAPRAPANATTQVAAPSRADTGYPKN